METTLLILAFVLAGVDWLAAERRWVRVRFVTKPAPMLALIAWFSFTAGWQGDYLWFGLALVLSVLGDFILLWEKLILVGIAVFSLAHVSYVIGLNQILPVLGLQLIFLLPVLAGMIWMVVRVRKALALSPQCRGLVIPVTAYSVLITLMMLSAWACLQRPNWPANAGWLAALGATFFVVSDFILAYNTVLKVRVVHGDVLGMITYHLGQIAIIAGVVLQAG